MADLTAKDVRLDPWTIEHHFTINSGDFSSSAHFLNTAVVHQFISGHCQARVTINSRLPGSPFEDVGVLPPEETLEVPCPYYCDLERARRNVLTMAQRLWDDDRLTVEVPGYGWHTKSSLAQAVLATRRHLVSLGLLDSE